MKSLKNHISLVVALFAILLTLQILISVDRVLDAYETKLSDRYAIVVVSDSNLSLEELVQIDDSIKSVEMLSIDDELKQIKEQLDSSSISFLELSLPLFYRLTLDSYPDPKQIEKLGAKLEKSSKITRVETFSAQHDTIFKLLKLFEWTITLLFALLFLVTMLLIVREMKLWQLQHHERINVMVLFGASIWQRSAFLFRLVITDAIIATVLAVIAFIVIDYSGLVELLLVHIGLNVNIFILPQDPLVLFVLALSLSTVLATIIIAGHTEEV